MWPSSLALLLPGVALLPAAAAAEEMVSLYFGCGCFWHVQHEFIRAEEEILKRSSAKYTAFTGYAGGNAVNGDGYACYSDYGPLGHTEVVSLRVPRQAVAAFAEVFWQLFVGNDRIDVMDVGPDYRAAIGVPGGMASDLLPVIRNSQKGNVQQTFELREGNGDDPDTLGQALVWVYDTAEYPFYQAELYHQFHDDFMDGGDYSDSYNALRGELQESCRLAPTPCSADRLERNCSKPVSAAAAQPWRFAGAASLLPLLLQRLGARAGGA